MRLFTISFNRTFMELKLNFIDRSLILNISFNRTFMELKYGNRRSDVPRWGVLIVPLWN